MTELLTTETLTLFIIFSFGTFAILLLFELRSILRKEMLEQSDNLLSKLHEDLNPFREKLQTLDDTGKTMLRLTDKVQDIESIFIKFRARGRVGEIHLEQLIEEQLPPRYYHFQKTLPNGRKPDCLLDFPQPVGQLAIDAKFPLESYLDYNNAKEDHKKIAAVSNFQSSMRSHVKKISEDYIIRGVTADKAMMFIPSEAVFAFLHENAANVVQEAYRKGVFIVSPATLWAVLNTMRAVLRDIEMREQVQKLRHHIDALGDNARRLNERATKLGRHFNQVGEDVRAIQTSATRIDKHSQQLATPEKLADLPSQKLS